MAHNIVVVVDRGQRALPLCKNGSGMVCGAEQLVCGVDLALKFLRSQSIQVSVEGSFMETSPHNLQNLKDLLLTAQGQIIHNIFMGTETLFGRWP